MPVSVTQDNKTLDATGELIYDSADDAMGRGCSTYQITRVSGDDVLVCVEGVHTHGDPSAGPFIPVTDVSVFAAHGDRITKVFAKARTNSATIHAGPISRSSPAA